METVWILNSKLNSKLSVNFFLLTLRCEGKAIAFSFIKGFTGLANAKSKKIVLSTKEKQ